MSKVFEAYSDFRDAQLALQIAQQNFDNAEPDFVDIAAEELTLAEKRLDLAVRKMKLLEEVSP